MHRNIKSTSTVSVSRLMKNGRVKKLTKIESFTQSTSKSTVHPYPRTTITHREQMRKTKDFLSYSQPSFDVVQQSAKLTSKDLRRQNNERKKDHVKVWIKCIIVMILLIIIATAIFLLVHFLPKPSTTTTKSPANLALRWNSTGVTIAGLTGSSGSNASQLFLPTDLVLNSLNTLYIADYRNSRVQKWLPGASSGVTVAGQSNGAPGSTAADLNKPDSVYIDSNENLYVSDTGNNRVQLWTSGATTGTKVAGTGSPGFGSNELQSPYGVIQDPSTKTLYIADYLNNRLMSYSSGASTGSVVAGGYGAGVNSSQLRYPVGIYLDSLTNSLLIANFGASNTVRWQLGATSWTLVAGNSTGLSGSTSTTLNSCTGVVLDPMGNVYVADAGNHRIQFFPAGQSEGRTIAGISGVNGADSTHLDSPYTVRLDSQLNLYVTDTANHRIQKFQRY